MFPLPLSRNMTTFVSRFTQTAFFLFYPTHLLQQKQSIAGPKFSSQHTVEVRAHHKLMLKKKGYILWYTHLGTNTDPSDGCTRFHRRVDDPTRTTIFAWGSDDIDRIEKPMLDTHYMWVNSAALHVE